MIPPFVQQIIGTVARAALVWLSAWLAAHGGPHFSDAQILNAATTITPVLVALAWSVWQKYRGRQKLMVALSMPSASTEAHVESLAKAGPSPSVNTPKTQVPATFSGSV